MYKRFEDAQNGPGKLVSDLKKIFGKFNTNAFEVFRACMCW